MYRIPQINQKIQRYTFLLILPSPILKKCAFGNILLVALGEKPKAFFEFMHFKIEYNLNFGNIFVKNSNLVFQPI